MIIHVFSYTGDGNDGRTVALNCSPDFVLIRGTLRVGVFRTSTMAGDLSKFMVGNTALTANLIQSLGTNQITVGNDDAINANGILYYGVAIEDNGAGDFAVASYTGNNTDDRVISLTGVTSPGLVIIGGDNAVFPHWRSNASPATDESYQFSQGGMLTNSIQAIGTTSITIGTSTNVNQNAITFHLVAIKPTALLFESGGYQGNGSDNRNIPLTNLTPTFGWLQSRANLSRNCIQRHADAHTGDQASDFQSGDGISANQIQAFGTNLFQVGNQSNVNTNLENFQYVMMTSGESSSGLALNRARRGWGL